MNRDPFEMSDEEANEFWEDLAEMYEDEPSHLDLSKGVGIETEPIVGWRVWRVQTRANETYESQTMGSLATLIKLAVENPIEEVLAQVAADVTLQPWGYSSGGAWPGYEAKEAQHHRGTRGPVRLHRFRASAAGVGVRLRHLGLRHAGAPA